MQPLAAGALPEFGLAVNDIRIRDDYLCAEFSKFRRLDGLDIGIDHRHDSWCFHNPVACLKAPDSTGAGFVEDFEDWGHDGLNYDGGVY